MAILCQDYNLLFIMTPRTACSAIGKVLREELNGCFFPKENILDSDGKIRVRVKHSSLQDLLQHNLLQEDQLSSLFIFSTVRNPFDSLVSLYVKKKTKYQHLLADPDSWIYKQSGYVDDMKFCQSHSFDEWLIKNYSPGWIKRLSGRGRCSLYEQYTKRCNIVLRFENIQHDFQAALKKAGIRRDLDIPVFNDTRDRKADYRQYYSKRSRSLVEYVFYKDLERFGYEF